MAKVKISEFSANPANNTDIDGINIAENCAPSGINDAIRELMAQLKDFQAGTAGDSFNGPVGTTTAAAGAFTTLAASGAVTLSGGTANGVAYLNGSKVLTTGSALTFDGSKLTVTSSGEQIKLTSSGDFSSTGTGYLRFYDSVGAKGYVGYGGTASRFDINTGSSMNLNMNAVGGTMTFQISNAEQMRLTSTGLGIGTSSPAYKLDINGVTRLGAGSPAILAGVGGAFAGGQGELYTISTNNMGIGTTGAAALRLYTNSALQATLDSSGNLGLGVTPSAWSNIKSMQVGAAASFSGGGSFNDAFIASNAYYDSANWRYINSNPAYYASVGGSAAARWYTAPSGTAGDAISFSQSMTLDASGNLLVGTTSNTNSAKVFSLATASGPAFACQGYSGDVSAPAAIFGKFDNNSTTSQVLVRFTINNNSAGSGQINANGANSAAFGSFSDARLKENIADLSGQLNNVMALRPVEFDYIESEGGGHQVGFIAQEMQEVYPDAVGERSDGMLTVTGWSKTEARLVKAIQEQQAIIESLKARLDAANL